MVIGKWLSALARAEEAEPTEAQVLIAMVLLVVVAGKVGAMAAAVVEAAVIGAVRGMAAVVAAGEMRQLLPWTRRRAREKLQDIVMKSGRLPTLFLIILLA